MRFKQPLTEQPIRLIADDHICKDADALSLWLGIPYDEVVDTLIRQDGNARTSIRGYAYEPADPVRPHTRRTRIEVIDRATGEVSIYDSLYEASVKMGVPEHALQQAKRGKGPYRLNYEVHDFR